MNKYVALAVIQFVGGLGGTLWVLSRPVPAPFAVWCAGAMVGMGFANFTWIWRRK